MAIKLAFGHTPAASRLVCKIVVVDTGENGHKHGQGINVVYVL